MFKNGKPPVVDMLTIITFKWAVYIFKINSIVMRIIMGFMFCRQIFKVYKLLFKNLFISIENL